MTPLAIRITNFRSFKKTQEFRFPQAPGLYFMEGINESEPRLEANGAGKSTIWEAFTWCLYGKTSRGLKAGDVNNWEAGKGTVVEIDYLTEAEEPCTVMRTWGPIKHRLRTYDAECDIAKDETNPVLADLRLDYQAFLGTVLMAQGQGMFLDMKPGPQAELFSEIMGLDKWLDLAAVASSKAGDDDAECRRLEQLLARAEGGLASMEGDDLKSLQEAWEVERQEKRDKLAMQYDECMELDYSKEDLKSAELVEFAARDHLSKHRVDDKARDLLKQVDAEVSKLVSAVAVLEARMQDAEDQLRRAERGEECRSCGQSLGNPAHLRAMARAYEIAESEFDKEHTDLGALLRERDEAEHTLVDREAEEREARKALQEAERLTADCRRAVAEVNRFLDKLEDEDEALKSARNPYDESQERLQATRRQLHQECVDLAADLDDMRRSHSIHSYWVRGFKEIRLGLIAEALIELEIEVNSGCEELGLVGWELRFQVDRETRGGSISRGFSVLVRAPGEDRLVPWEAWSGGEAQRLRLATQMGLANLIRARTGATIPLEVWDEPTRDLSTRGVQDLLEALASRAIRERRQIWLVDHHTHAFGGFAGSAVIIKTPSGSRIRQR